MAGSAHIPNSPACGLWETLLADALDGLLKPEDEATFGAHMAICPACTALFEEARKGREWLEFLSSEPEVPEGLLAKILAQTGPGQIEGYGLMPAAAGNVLPMPQPWQRPGFAGYIRRFAEPRLMMTAAMAFFSIALTLNLTGVHITSLRLSDLRPTAVRSFMQRQVSMASTPLIRYYDHLRFVYEVESRMREFRRSTEGDNQNNPQPPAQTKPNGSGETKQNPGGKNGGSRVDPPQQSGTPANTDSNDIYDYSLALQNGPAHSGGSRSAFLGARVRERSTQWTA
jgi:hypothetical protein